MDVYDNINTYLDIVEHLFVCDNSENKNEELLDKLKNNDKITFIDMNGNQGIAKALKIGAKKCIDKNYDFCLTMDQDSKFPTDKMDKISSYLTMDNIDDYGIIALDVNNDGQDKSLVEVNYVITSGNFINLKNYKLIEGFKEELFIDLVDFELCEQFYNVDKKVAYIKNVSLKHKIGNPVRKRFLFKKFNCSNHPPIRLYYRYRNTYYLYHKNKLFYKDLYKYEFHIMKFKILLFENNKLKKFKMMKKGIRDAKRGILGKYKDS